MPGIGDAPENSRRPRPIVAFYWVLTAAVCGVALGPAVWRAMHPAPPRGDPGGAVLYSVPDGRGKRITLHGYPQRIVSLSPGTTEMLFAIGLRGQIVADTTYCDYPPEAKQLPKIGDVNTSTEKVLAMRPDLVVADAIANRRAIEALERLHLPVFAVTQNDLKSTFATLSLLGQVTGNGRQAGDLIGYTVSQVEEVRRVVAHDPKRPRVLDIVQMEPLMVAGRDNFMDDLILRAGGINVARDSGPGWNTYSPEKVVVQRPDVILTDPAYIALVRSRAGWAHVPAVERGAIYALRSEAARPGPRLVDALKELAGLLHPAMARRSR